MRARSGPLCVFASLALVGCGGGDSPASSGPPPVGTTQQILVTQWSTLDGPDGGWVGVISTCSGGRVLARADDRLYGSDDSGSTWTRISVPSVTRISGVICGLQDQAVVATLDDRMFFSTDRGEAWSESTVPAGLHLSRDFVAGPGGVFYLPAHDRTTDAYSLLVSNDGGASWQLTAPVPGGARLLSVADLGGGLLVGGANAGLVFRSSDSGMTWTEVYEAPASGSFMTGGAFVDLVVLPNQTVVGRTAYPTGLFRSVNAGLTWQTLPLTEFAPGRQLDEMARTASGDLLVAQGQTLFASSDAGDSWSGSPLEIAAYSAYALEDQAAGLLIGSSEGIWRDGSPPTATGFPITRIDAALVTQTGAVIVGAQGGPSGRLVRRGPDGWDLKFWSMMVTDLRRVGSRVLAALIDPMEGEGGWILLSDDDGETWQGVLLPANGSGINRFATDNAGRIYGAGNFGFVATQGLFRSRDRGSTWETITQVGLPPDELRVFALAVHRGSLFLVRNIFVEESTSATDVYRWPLGSARWLGPEAAYLDFADLESVGGQLFAARGDGLYVRSGEDIWDRVPGSPAQPVRDLAPDLDGSLLVVTPTALLRYRPDLGSWDSLSDEMPDINLRRVAADEDRYVVGTNSDGVWQLGIVREQ
jgi:photosystem II stability/assembly factor-like uncharacterized protein